QAARSHGAKLLTVSCPLCKYNLEASQKQDPAASSSSEPLPVVYFTQLLGLALGVSPEDLRLSDTQLQTIRGSVKSTVESVSQP
ncbi:MAG: hypothetical protein ABSG74_14370, partial [Candidatus Bathyarchaeia archaeon]